MKKVIRRLIIFLVLISSINISVFGNPSSFENRGIFYLNHREEIKSMIDQFIEEERIEAEEAAEKARIEASRPEARYLATFTLTAYCSCYKCCGEYALNRPLDEDGNPIVYTSIGAIAKPNHTISVDPSVIPYGTEVVINGITYVAEDCGSGVNGYHIDVYFDDHEAALQFGTQLQDVYLVV